MKTKPRYSLLYVEDEEFIRSVVVSFLEDHFCEIYEASSGQEALKLYKQNKPDIIITDIEMPFTNGLELCKKIRKIDKLTPIIIMSAYSKTEYLLEAMELNLVKYLIKPVEEESLFSALKLCYERIESKDPSVVSLGEGYRYDIFNQILTHEKKIIDLSASQSLLLEILIKNRGSVVSYLQLENAIWYDSYMSKDALRCLVRDIRKNTYKKIIENISKVGYKVNYDG